MARLSIEVYATSGAMPASRNRLAAWRACSTPCSVRSTSVHPAKRSSRFHVLCPCRTKTKCTDTKVARRYTFQHVTLTGSFRLLFLYDVAEEIRLERLRQQLGVEARSASLRQLRFAAPPVVQSIPPLVLATGERLDA